MGKRVLFHFQGNFLTINSEPETMARNSGVFWAMLQSSMLLGNAFVFAEFQASVSIFQTGFFWELWQRLSQKVS